MHESISDIQFDILDVLYFVEPFDKIVEETGAPRAIVLNELRTLISKRYVTAMVFQEEVKDFVPSAIYDADHMEDYHYLATKDGLLKHSGRR